MRILLAIFVVVTVGCTSQPIAPATTWPKPATPPYLLHLPGIAGERWIDRNLIRGLVQGGFDGETEIYDWTGEDQGLIALTNNKRHKRQSAIVAERITAVRRENPAREIVLIAHSGGTGVAVYALERLPEDVHVDRVILLASALSPEYDLSAALRHVDGAMFSFSSLLDVAVLNVGTTMMGTIDGRRVAAAGCLGFTVPTEADHEQYMKLHQFEYSGQWMQWGNTGSHIGAMARPFARAVLAPLAMGRTVSLPPLPLDVRTGAATQPLE
jgi:pimeloyl-ACP methyl ester carboxylesterase